MRQRGGGDPVVAALTQRGGEGDGAGRLIGLRLPGRRDVGFTNNIASVLNIYWHTYFPKAVETAHLVNKPGHPPVFKYTSHAWLLDLFFDCPRQLGLNCSAASGAAEGRLGTTPDDHPACVVCPSAAEVALVEKAIADDVITWHAYPFNAEPELADAGLLRAVCTRARGGVRARVPLAGSAWRSAAGKTHACHRPPCAGHRLRAPP
eukprot:COSAG01_NODE_185_length_22691_cov_53.142478_24_plen_206_part_00